MLDVQLLRNDLDGVAKRLATRGITIPIDDVRVGSPVKQSTQLGGVSAAGEPHNVHL